MNRFSQVSLILIAAAACAAAQRLDDCQVGGGPLGGPPQTFRSKSADVLDSNLKGAGYTFAHDSLLSALRDPRSDVRSLAAGKLAENEDTGAIEALAEALSADSDDCARMAIRSAIGRLGERLVWPSNQHARGQRHVTPFQACTPSAPPVVTLTIEQEAHPANPSNWPVVRIAAKNVSSRVIPFIWTFSPAELFSVTLLEPGGGKARIPGAKEWFYHPLAKDHPPFSFHDPMGMALAPGEEAAWDWVVGSDFDLSTPGTYRLSLGGPIEYLTTTVCSNMIDVTVDAASAARRAAELKQVEEQQRPNDRPVQFPWSYQRGALKTFVPIYVEGHAQDSVKIRLVTDKEGNVAEVTVTGPSSGVEEAVKAGVLRWKFKQLVFADGPKGMLTEFTTTIAGLAKIPE